MKVSHICRLIAIGSFGCSACLLKLCVKADVASFDTGFRAWSSLPTWQCQPGSAMSCHPPGSTSCLPCLVWAGFINPVPRVWRSGACQAVRVREGSPKCVALSLVSKSHNVTTPSAHTLYHLQVTFGGALKRGRWKKDEKG